MTTLDDELATMASELNTALGGDLTFVELTKTYSRTTGDTTLGSETLHVVKGAILPYEDRLINGSTILESDVMTTISSLNLGFTPIVGMEMRKGAEAWIIVSVKPLGGDTTAAYELQLRG
jgi:hypothetical protein